MGEDRIRKFCILFQGMGSTPAEEMGNIDRMEDCWRLFGPRVCIRASCDNPTVLSRERGKCDSNNYFRHNITGLEISARIFPVSFKIFRDLRITSLNFILF